jgi:hypothetical protein
VPDLVEAYCWFDYAGAFYDEKLREGNATYQEAFRLRQEVRAKMTSPQMQEVIARQAVGIYQPQPEQQRGDAPIQILQPDGLVTEIEEHGQRVCLFLNQNSGEDTRASKLLSFLLRHALADPTWAPSTSELAEDLYRIRGGGRLTEQGKLFDVHGTSKEEAVVIHQRKVDNLKNLKGELNQKLHGYYEGKGRYDPVRFSLQRASWRPLWAFHDPVEPSDKPPDGWDRIEVHYSDTKALPQAKSFIGKWVIPPDGSFETSLDWGYLLEDEQYHKGAWKCAVAVTAKGRVVVHSRLAAKGRRSGCLHRVYDYDSFADAFNLEPEGLIYQAAEAAGIRMDALDI